MRLKKPMLKATLNRVSTRVGEMFDSRVSIETDRPLHVIGVRIDVDPKVARIVGWSLGSGLRQHVAENGEPPACDVIVYPDGSRMFSIMALDVPYASEEWGTDWLDVELEVTSSEPKIACMLVRSATTEDYEPGQDPEIDLSNLTDAGRCGFATIREPLAVLRGDIDDDGIVRLNDVILTLRHLFLGSVQIDCPDAADMNDDGVVSIADPIAALMASFGGEGSSISCAPDLTIDRLRCERASCSGV